MAERPALHALADAAGILPDYLDIGGTRRFTSDATRVALLAALGIDASSEEAAAKELSARERRSDAEILEPVLVRRVGVSGGRRLRAHVPERWRQGRIDFRLQLERESGELDVAEGTRRLRGGSTHFGVELPVWPPEIGYHRVHLHISGAAGEVEASAPLIVAPGQCLTIEEVAGSRKVFGIWTHLYAVRSARNWGIGDLTDLEWLIEWSRDIGAAFVGINPLHALRNSGADISPYSPVSRLFRNVIYLDVTRIPELAEDPEARGRLESRVYREALSGLRAAERVDYDAVMALKLPILESLYSTFKARHRDRGDSRGTEYSAYLTRKGETLTDFATYLALARHFREQGVSDWRSWPPTYRHPRSPEVERFRRERFEEVDRYRYLQFELDRQLAQVAERAQSLGLPIGIYGDLAIGTAIDACDTWMFPDLFVEGARLGAPPDDYALEGQEWGLPPLDPRRLRRDGYRYWIRLLQNNFEHTGALRIDHAMGLLRQWWVPEGEKATGGAYVRMPSDELLAVLALESRRREVVVIGEDLGTVPRGFQSLLARWGILSYRVLYFERRRNGAFKPARRYSRRALVTANTHDHPPLAGIFERRDIELEQEVGLVTDDDALREKRQRRDRDLEQLLRRLEAEKCLDDRGAPHSYGALCAAVHAFLSKTPAPLLGVRLGDLLGEVDPLNIPGVGHGRYPNWSQRLSSELEGIKDDPVAQQALSGTSERRID